VDETHLTQQKSEPNDPHFHPLGSLYPNYTATIKFR